MKGCEREETRNGSKEVRLRRSSRRKNEINKEERSRGEHMRKKNEMERAVEGQEGDKLDTENKKKKYRSEAENKERKRSNNVENPRQTKSREWERKEQREELEHCSVLIKRVCNYYNKRKLL